GTAAYMSPEQALADESVDGRSDVYSLGCVVYEALNGNPPFIGATPLSVVAQHIGVPAPALTTSPSLPSSAVRAVARALEKKPANRFDSVTAFARALHAADATRET